MRTNIDKIIVNKNSSIINALKVLNDGAKGIILVVDEKKKLLGTITDGDVRRAILKGVSLDDSIEKIIHYDPVTVKENMSMESIKDIFIKKAVKEIPILDNNNVLIDMLSLNDVLLPEGKGNPVVIMAGGLGSRLKDLTYEIPKPMLKVGQDPILQHIINNFKQYGYNKIYISVNYKSEIIENYFQDGSAHGVKIEYIKEKNRLGTAGSIRLTKDYINKPFFVINGDIFTNLFPEKMMDFHNKMGFDMTVGIRKYSYQIPYGVIKTENNYIQELNEKPVIEYLINAGVYCLNPDLLEYIPENEYFEITDLINICIKNNKKVGSYEIKEYWMDIGKIEDYNKVNEDVQNLVAYDKAGNNND